MLIVEGTTTDGRTGRWAFEGLPPNVHQYRDLKDYKERARAFTAGTIAFADGTTMLFGIPKPGEGDDSWTCPSPCPYTYPVP